MRIYIVRWTGASQGEHPFLGHPGREDGSDQGIASGVLNSPSIKTLHSVIKAQSSEKVILCPWYLIASTREGSNALSLDPPAPLPLWDLIFLHKEDDLQAWLLAKDGKHPLDLMVLESHLEEAGDDRLMPEPIMCRHLFFDRNVWEHSRQAEDRVGGIPSDNEDKEDNHIVVRNRRMRQQSGERWDEMEDMDHDEDDEGVDVEEDDGEEDDSEDDVAADKSESQMPQERETIVIDVSLLCFSYFEEYPTQ